MFNAGITELPQLISDVTYKANRDMLGKGL